ncbi:MAG: nitrous oxide reductase accessory protein NosL [Epsilonproteobacteria bacterium]|nr:nitrous oxide reductase accessory protein NosL [Campylobacterota bacterium]
MKYFSFLFLFLFFIGCDGKVDTSAKEVNWDRDVCERCKMLISERNYAAQTINPHNGKVYMFDDIGCVILWFKEQNIAWKNEAIIYVKDIDTGGWIDARKAIWSDFNITPMSYGFAAHSSKEKIKTIPERNILDYSQVEKFVLKAGR